MGGNGPLTNYATIREYFFKDPSQFDPRKYLIETMKGMKKIVVERLESFGTAGNASKIKPLSMSVIASKYSSGELAQTIN